MLNDYLNTRIDAKARELNGLLAMQRQPMNREPEFSIARAIADMTTGNLCGADREACEEFARQAGKPFDPQRIEMPLTAIATRDLVSTAASAGGFLVSTDVLTPRDALRPYSAAARAGLTIVDMRGNGTIPRTTATTTAAWLGAEATAVDATAPVLGATALAPHVAAAALKVSRLLWRQGVDTERVVRRELLRTVGALVDRAVLGGTGAGGQPLGIANTPGVDTESGGTIAYTGILAMQEAVGEANAADEQVSFVATPAVRRVLSGRERSTNGAGLIWDNGRVAGHPAYVTTSMPTGTLICGAFDQAVLALWGGTITVEVSPAPSRTDFMSGILTARCLMSVDVGLVSPAAFSVATSVS